MSIKVIQPFCNLETIRDGRGGIFTWLPKEPIVEFNLLFFKPGKTRGFHYHPHFVEYLLCVEGNGVLVTRENKNDAKTETSISLSKGVCTRADKNTKEPSFTWSFLLQCLKNWTCFAIT